MNIFEIQKTSSMYIPKIYKNENQDEIIEYLKEWCLSKNIIEIRLDVYDTNISAIKSYEKSGFKKDMVNMRVRLK